MVIAEFIIQEVVWKNIEDLFGLDFNLLLFCKFNITMQK